MMSNWSNRIVNYGEETPQALAEKAHPLNWRQHPDYQAEAMEANLDKIGWIDDVIVNKTTGRMIDGHLRVKQALAKGVKAVPVKYVELTEDEENYALATFDPIAALAEADTEMLARINEELDEDLSQFFSEDDWAEVVQEETTEGEDTPPQIDKAAELQAEWSTESGQLWELGEHRLICGDCTDGDVVSAIAPEVDMMFTDPPYGVSYGAKNEYLNAIARGNSIQTPIENDQQSEKELELFLRAFLASVFSAMKDGCVYYLCSPAGSTETVFRNALTASGLDIRQEIVWYKNHFVLGRQDYQWIHETLLYGWKSGAAHLFNRGDAAQSTVWEIDRPYNSDLHPTGKPVELVERAVMNSSNIGDLVLDPFVGSGTTLIACQNLNRKCRAIEIDPGYVAVTLQRFKDHTGIEPRLIDG